MYKSVHELDNYELRQLKRYKEGFLLPLGCTFFERIPIHHKVIIIPLNTHRGIFEDYIPLICTLEKLCHRSPVKVRRVLQRDALLTI